MKEDRKKNRFFSHASVFLSTPVIIFSPYLSLYLVLPLIVLFSLSFFFLHLFFSPYSPCPSPAGTSAANVCQLEHFTAWKGGSSSPSVGSPACEPCALIPAGCRGLASSPTLPVSPAPHEGIIPVQWEHAEVLLRSQ